MDFLIYRTPLFCSGLGPWAQDLLKGDVSATGNGAEGVPHLVIHLRHLRDWERRVLSQKERTP